MFASAHMPSPDRAAMGRLLAAAERITADMVPDNEAGAAYLESLGEARRLNSALWATQEELDYAEYKLWAAHERVLGYIIDPGAPKASNRLLLRELFIHGFRCAYDEASGTFFFPSAAQSGGYVRARDFSFTPGLEEPVLIIWDDVAPEFGVAYNITVVSRDYIYSYRLIFTGLPIVQISGVADEQMSRDFIGCGFSLVYYDQGLRRVESAAKIRHRGASSMQYPKKPYMLRLVDRRGYNNMPLLGMRDGSAWILDAMYVDRSKMRNRVSTDIWNSFSSPLAHESISPEFISNGTRGRFVELFIGDEYRGLYCMTETINRRQLGLLRYNPLIGVQSMRFKGEVWADAILMRGYAPGPLPGHNTWGGWRQDFPDPRRGLPVFWEPIYNFVRFNVNSCDEQFAARVADYIDINNFVDYTILISIIFAFDNNGKNLIWSIYDINDPELSRIFLTPWDLKASFGDSWKFGRTNPDFSWIDISVDAPMWRRLVNTNAGGFRDKLEARWRELRHAQLSPESLKGHFRAYFDLFEATGAWEREMARWPREEFGDVSLAGEREYIFDWIERRWAFVDDLFDGRLDELQHNIHGRRY